MTESNCDVCEELDNLEMVQCDTCDKWLHFKCAKVTASVKNMDFVCQKCKKKEAEKKAAQKAEIQRGAAELSRFEKEQEKIRVERDRIESERAERDRVERDRIESERAERDRVERDRIESERIEKDQVEREQVERGQVERDKIERERVERNPIEHELAEWKRVERERIERKERDIFERKERDIFERQERENIERQRQENFERQRVNYNSSDRNRLADLNNYSSGREAKSGRYHAKDTKSQSSKCSKRQKNADMLKLLEEQRRNVEETRRRQAEEDRLYFEQKIKLISEMEDSDTSSEGSAESDGVKNKEACAKWASEQRQSNQKVSFKSALSKSSSKTDVVSGTIRREKLIPAPTNDPGKMPLLSTKSQREFLDKAASGGVELCDLGFKDSMKRIAARHLYDLPTFNGCPSEWPMFMASYMRSTTSLNLSNSDNLSRLQKCLKGDAMKLVRNFLVYEESVPRAIDALRIRFGRPELVLEQMIAQVRALPRINTEKLETILDLSMAVQQLCVTMEASGMMDHLNNPMLLQELVEKLPGTQKIDWASYKKLCSVVNLSAFDAWLYELSDKVSSVMSIGAVSSKKPEEKSITRRNDNRREFVHSVHSGSSSTYRKDDVESSDNNYPSKYQCSICADGDHKVSACPKFIEKNVSDRWDDIKQHELCRKCLVKHNWKSCRSTKKCNVDECPYKHHKLLHDASKHSPASRQQDRSHTVQNIVAIHSMPPFQLLFRVVPVILYGPARNISTFAFLDEGSSRTLMDDEIAYQLQLDGPIDPIHLKWSNDIKRVESNSRRISLEISGEGEHCSKHRISNIRTVEKLDLISQSFSFDPTTTQYRHLRNLPISKYQHAKPRILIGVEHWHLALPLKIREGKLGEPTATKTRLGWTVMGPYQESASNDAIQHHHHYQICECTPDENLHSQVKEFFSIENFGVKAPETKLESREDSRANKILKDTTKKLGNHYETGLLWRYDEFKLPDSYPMAMQRLQCLERKLTKMPDIAITMKDQIRDYVRKGYARKLSSEEAKVITPRTWYLPIFTVTNANKPGKIRMVWDAAATVNGVSLNSMLLKGPDLLCSLPDMLFRFREHRTAIAGDIKEMYHQVGIREEDQNSQRFLWRENSKEDPSVFVMRVMTFGATCSPSAAHYVKNTNALRFIENSPRAVEAICNNHYVDDWLDSFPSEEEACRVAQEVSRIHKVAEFTIRNWVSNSKKVLEELGVEVDKQHTMNLNIGNDCEGSKVLGMWWDTQRDSFYYALDFSRLDTAILQGFRRPTKREVLRTLMMIFDPLGLIALFLIFVKMLLQEIWRSAIDWDQEINECQQVKWMKWVKMLPLVRNIEIPRCHFGDNYKSLQLHVFVDASDSAFAAVAYFRFETSTNIKCSLIAAKTKVAPLQPLSIPRLELQAAVLGSRLCNSIRSAHTIIPDRTVLWSDSIDVLSWLRSDHRKYRQYVAFRVGEILETTNLTDWRWVPTKHNVADEATKWKDQSKISSDSRWYSSPDFLQLPEAEWPVEARRESKFKTSEEEKTHMAHIIVLPDMITEIMNKYSQWRRVYRITAWVLRYLNNLNKTKPKIIGVLTPDEIKRAKSKFYRQAQLEEYPEEMALLKLSPQMSVEKTSRLYQKSPFLDELGVLRMRGRTGKLSLIPKDVVNPILLPQRHKVTQLIVTHFHERYLHLHHETVINEVRQLYSVPHLRVVLNQIRTNCQFCKNARALPNPPEMADHPMARLAAGARPFSFVGIDYFGPLEVVIGRRVEKRWGCLFTCLTIRAIHVEIAHSLSKDSCIMCIRNFIARRGMPLEIRTDNGTNFIGVRNELRKLTQQIPLNEIKDQFDEIKWILNTPLAPHMGGCWERQIRSLKRCLEIKMPTKRPDDENLRCYLLEVESMINSRPLTYIPVGPDEPEALTPNHFLLGSSGGMKPFCEFQDDVLTMRRNYKLSQHMALVFWKRWLKEYLPTLTRRTKWYKRTKPIEIGDIVVIMDEGKRNSWAKGVIIDTIIGRTSDQVRTVVVKTATGTYARPATKVAVLDVDNAASKPKQ